jgi:hypothetical protein
VEVRDKALGMANEGLPESDPGKEYALNRMQVGWRPAATAAAKGSTCLLSR